MPTRPRKRRRWCAVRDAESWVERVKSLRITAETKWVAPEPIPGAAVPLPPVAARPESVVLGFDDRRIYYRALGDEYHLIDHRTWDGAVAVYHSKYDAKHKTQEQYVLDKDAQNVAITLMGSFAWPRAEWRR